MYTVYFGEIKVGYAPTEEKARILADKHRRGNMNVDRPGIPGMRVLQWKKTESGAIATNGKYKILFSS